MHYLSLKGGSLFVNFEQVRAVEFAPNGKSARISMTAGMGLGAARITTPEDLSKLRQRMQKLSDKAGA